MTLFKSDKDIRTLLLEEYRLVMVDITAPNAAKRCLKDSVLETVKGVGFPIPRQFSTPTARS